MKGQNWAKRYGHNQMDVQGPAALVHLGRRDRAVTFADCQLSGHGHQFAFRKASKKFHWIALTRIVTLYK